MRIVAVVLTIAATILIFAVSVLAQGSPARDDPFLPYADLLSSYQARLAIKDDEFICTFILMEAGTRCTLYPKDTLFSEIGVWLTFDVPKSVSFLVINNSLRLGDLALLWGMPEKLSSFYIHWPEQNGVTPRALVPTADRLNYFTPVQVVTFDF